MESTMNRSNEEEDTPVASPSYEVEDNDDDDMDYEPAPESAEDEDESEEELEDEDFQDAENVLSPIHIEFEIRGDDGEVIQQAEDDDEAGNAGIEDSGQTEARPTVYITRDQILQLLGHAGLRRIFANHATAHRADSDSDGEGQDEGGDHNEGNSSAQGGDSTSKRPLRGRRAFEKVPSDVGRELMESGIFGTNERRRDTIKRKKRLAYKSMIRELGLDSVGRQRSVDKLISQNLIPSSNADLIIHYDSRCYSGQFSNDGNFFFSCAQDFKVRMYDTSNLYRWRYYKTVNYPFGQWTITDASLSPDNRFLAYSSIRNVVCLAPTDPADSSEPYLLEFAGSGWRGGSHFGIWSLRFSGDGREIVAGVQGGCVYVYDVEARQTILRIPGHSSDVNAVCFGDSQSPHILYSGSDDTTLKVWDRRSLADSREAGVFLGHTEGLTYVDSKGDGRYVLSNAKDQTAKLWDLRKMISTEKADKIDPMRYTSEYDYRFNSYDERSWRPHPHDCSLVTFRGHKVLKTLIRCHFSPPGSTDSRYVYSGSYDGSVYIWNLDATLKGKVDVFAATKNSRPKSNDALLESFDFLGREGDSWRTCVRDASWHPYAPVIAATAWNGWGTSLGTCSVHSWDDGIEDDEGEPKMGLRVDPQLDPNESFYRSSQSPAVRNARQRTRRRTGFPQIFDQNDADE